VKLQDFKSRLEDISPGGFFPRFGLGQQLSLISTPNVKIRSSRLPAIASLLAQARRAGAIRTATLLSP
jgi:hypothetical protein